jgi:hypothetical protein
MNRDAENGTESRQYLKPIFMLVAHDNKLSDLTKRLIAVEADLSRLSERRAEVKDIIELIKAKKGWTTPAELAFANTIVGSLHAQVQQLDTMVSSFKTAARQVEIQM